MFTVAHAEYQQYYKHEYETNTGEHMAAIELTPLDETTGVPLPLVPIINSFHPDAPEINWHHHFHPRRSELLSHELPGGVALRTSRLQRSYKFGNHTEYHQYYEGPPLPQTTEERFRTVVLAHAGYIPDHALLMRRYLSPKVVRLTEPQRDQLWQEGHIRSGSPGEVRNFFAQYILVQDLTDISEITIEEFITTRDVARKRFLGNWLLAQAIERAAEPVNQTYREAWRNGRIPQTHPYKSLSFVAKALGQQRQRDHLVHKMANQLVA